MIDWLIDKYMLHPTAGRYPIAVTLPMAVTFSMIDMKMILSELFSLQPSVVIIFLHKFVRKYSRYYLSFLEKLLSGHARLFSPDVSLFHWTLLFLKSRVNSRWCRSFFPCLFGLKLPYIEHFPLFLPPLLFQLAQENSLALAHEYYAPTQKVHSR